jgi:NB-ARC domain
VGKTALAVHWAHQQARRFPDGQLYVDLRGYDPSGAPMQAATAVRQFLDALPVPAASIPAGLDAQIGLYRSLLAGKRMLVVLDNARDAGQVRPLLPGTAGCVVLITSRRQLPDLIALDGAIPLTVNLLTTEEARELLASRLGPARVSREREAADELIGLCARLPLALNIATSRAATHPGTPLSSLAAELRDTRRCLDLLSAGTGAANMRAVFSWSYQALTRPAAQMFRLLGMHPGPDISVAATASLAAVGRDQARRALDELTAAHLLTEHVPGRYSLHDLLRAYAAEQAEATSSHQDCRAAIGRVLDHYLHTARAATLLLYPARDLGAVSSPLPGTAPEQLTDDQHALAWFDSERQVLLAVTALAAKARFDVHAWQMPSVLAAYLERRGHWHDYAGTQTAALGAAERAGDLAGQANARLLLGRACSRTDSRQAAQVHLRHALDLYEKLGDRAGQPHDPLRCG